MCYPTFLLIIQYGCDCLCLTKNDIVNLNRLESNVLKDSLCLFRRIKSTELFRALKILPPLDNLVKMKLNLFLRLAENQFTFGLIKNLIEESRTRTINNSLLNEIISLTNIDLNNITIESIKIGVMVKLNEIHASKKQQEDNNILVSEIRTELLKNKIDTKKIEELLEAFEAYSNSDNDDTDSD